MLNLGIKSKTLLPLLTILVIAMSGLAVYNYYSQVALLNQEAEDTLRSTLNSTQNIISDRAKQYEQMAILMAEMPHISELFAKDNRNKLITELQPAFENLKKNFQLNRLHFYKPAATSFLRMHDIPKFGDDEKAYRHAIVYVNEKKAATRGVEIGARGLSLRGIEPVFSSGRHLGAIEFGGELSPSIDEAKTVFNIEGGILLSKQAMLQVLPDWQQQDAVVVENYIFFYSTNTQLTQGLLKPNILKAKAGMGGIIIERGSSAGRNYSIAMGPLNDFSGKSIGFLYIFKDQTELLAKIRRVLIINVAIYFSILLAISLAINYSLNKTVINPVLSLTQTADEISMGKLTEKIEVTTDDEISTLAKAIDRMRVSMKKLLE
jgi:HAMP domain-containing protein